MMRRARAAVREATALLITAGAGMGVDSGLPDFRGPEGFWRAYPPYRHLGLRFEELASPHWFRRDPPLAWGFYGHRLMLYRATRPHDGFSALIRLAEGCRGGAFVYTSNVDGQFQIAGFDLQRIAECHGSIHRLQCLAGCGQPVFDAAPFDVEVDLATMRAREPFPSCPRCGALARPNILMFGDWDWDASVSRAQAARLAQWLDSIVLGGHRLAIIECGAGTALPAVRWMSEQAARAHGGTLIRINTREPQVPAGQISLAAPAREALLALATD
jgi:NAD-dependent SIR2 family protein deacetylase